MSSHPARLLALLSLSAALVAGCGGSSGSSESPAPSKPKATNNGQLNVGVTDGGIGTATQGDRDGLQALPDTKVDKPSNTETGVGAGASCQNTDIAPTRETLPIVVAATLCLLNGERQDAGLAPLSENAKLAAAAIVHSREMVDKQFFAHQGRDGSDPVTRIRSAGYIPSVGAWTVGENLAWGTGTLATPKEIVGAWMKSQGHRDNILRAAYKEIGFGVVVGNPKSDNGAGATYTTAFGGLTLPNATRATKSTRAKRRKVRKVRRARSARANAAKRKGKAKARISRPSGSR